MLDLAAQGDSRSRVGERVETLTAILRVGLPYLSVSLSRYSLQLEPGSPFVLDVEKS